MPNLFQIKGYHIYFWSNENDEPLHIHISEGQPSKNATKVWLTSKGGTIVANNNSKIPQNKLNDLLEAVQAQFFYICQRWMSAFKVEKIKFYC